MVAISPPRPVITSALAVFEDVHTGWARLDPFLQTFPGRNSVSKLLLVVLVL
jgi:hypothetical protein